MEIDSGHKSYKLYQINFYSDHIFYNHLLPGGLAADSDSVVFSCSSNPPIPINLQSEKKVYTSPYLTADGESIGGIYQFDDFQVIRIFGVADYYLKAGRIDCHMLKPVPIPLIESYLFGVVMAFWLEYRGIPVLHASAVTIENQGVAFLGHSRNGKSTLTAALLLEGCSLLTDDNLPIEEYSGKFWALSGLPQIKLWPDQIKYLIGTDLGFRPVLPDISKKLVPVGLYGFGAFCDLSQPLRCIYLPERFDPGQENFRIEINPLRPAEAVIELARFSYINNVVQELGLQGNRLDFFTRLVQQVPVHRIRYPTSFEHLHHVTQAIIQDLESLPN